MKANEPVFCVDQMATVLGVSRSGYYDYVKRSLSMRVRENQELLRHIRRIFHESGDLYGSPRIHAELNVQGIPVSRPRVARLMRASGLQAKMYRKFIKTTTRSKNLPEKPQDLIQRAFTVASPNRVWVADITYVRVAHTWVYLAVVLDLFSRKIVGMALEKTMKVDLILTAFKAALMSRNPPKGLIHHSDRGSQYTSQDMAKLAKKHGVRLSYGQCAYDNAVMESFFHTLKTERIYFERYQTLEEARMDIFTYIYTFYNPKRRHSTLNYQTPNMIETNYEHSHKNIYILSVR